MLHFGIIRDSGTGCEHKETGLSLYLEVTLRMCGFPVHSYSLQPYRSLLRHLLSSHLASTPAFSS